MALPQGRILARDVEKSERLWAEVASCLLYSSIVCTYDADTTWEDAMQKAFENSCAKGCMVYVVALVLILVLSTIGWGDLALASARARPGASKVPLRPPQAKRRRPWYRSSR